MIVVTIIGILAAIAIPNFIRNRAMAQKRTCISNMRAIETAAENWLSSNFQEGISTADWVEKLVGPVSYIKSEPHCPSGGSYIVEVDQETGVLKVACTKDGHELRHYKDDDIPPGG